MNFTDLTKAEIIVGIQKTRYWSFIDGAEQAAVRIRRGENERRC